MGGANAETLAGWRPRHAKETFFVVGAVLLLVAAAGGPFFSGQVLNFGLNLIAELAGLIAALLIAWYFFEKRAAAFEERVKDWLHIETTRADTLAAAKRTLLRSVRIELERFMNSAGFKNVEAAIEEHPDEDSMTKAEVDPMLKEAVPLVMGWDALRDGNQALLPEVPQIVHDMAEIEKHIGRVGQYGKTFGYATTSGFLLSAVSAALVNTQAALQEMGGDV